MITFGSVCSGIEAASVAWSPLGWVAAWLAEIEAFPSAVLRHRYPNVPNLGDMTKIARAVLTGEVPAPDVLAGGTPCQAFSIAGLRESLDDARGNLTLKFVELLDAIDHVRSAAGKPEAVAVWENVPGVLTTHDNAFGCFLAGLAGEDGPLEPPEPCPIAGKSSRWWRWDKKTKRHAARWANAGAIYGPRRAVAWRVMDAQYFGVAQRRRRVFVISSARNGFDPAEVLFEWGSLRRDSAPSREAKKDLAPCLAAGAGRRGGIQREDGGDGLIVGALTAGCGPNGHGGSGLATDKGAEAGHILAFGGNNTAGPIEVSTALRAKGGTGHNDFESETFIASRNAEHVPAVTHSLRGEGFDASEDGSGRGTPLIAFQTRGSNLDVGDIAGTLGTNADRASGSGPMVAQPAYSTKMHNTASNQAGKVYEEYATSLDAHSPPPAVFQPLPFDTTQITSAANRSSPKVGDPCHPLAAGMHAPAIAFHGSQDPDISGDVTHPVGRNQGQETCALTGMKVRRLTPTECERLQGFEAGYWRPDEHPPEVIDALIAECPDGPRYKALGNSWAVPNVRWIGRRLAAHLAKIEMEGV